LSAARFLDWPSVRFLRLLAVATLAYAAFAHLRLGGDSYYYFAYLRTVWLDFDLDFTNQYAAANPLWLAVHPETGRPVNQYPPGAALLWSPFFLIAHAIARAAGHPAGADAGPLHVALTLWGTVVYGAMTIALARAIVRRWFPEPVASIAVGAVALATPFAYYWCVHPAMSHVPSAFALTLFLYLVLGRRAADWTVRYALAVGLALGLAVCVRPQSGLAAVLLAPLAFDAWVSVRVRTRTAGDFARCAVALAAGALIAIAPLLVCWRVLYGAWLLVPQGHTYMEWSRPALLDSLFSTRHGVFTWSPILIACAIGLVPFARRVDRRWGPLLIALWAAQAYVNAAATDWWGGYGFGARRMVDWTVVPMLGAAALLDGFRRRMADEPENALRVVGLAAALPFVLLAVGMMAAFENRRVPPASTVESVQLYAAGMDAWYRFAGNPVTWPASVPFAVEFGVAPWKYDVIGGRYFLRNDTPAEPVLRFADPRHRVFLTRGWRGDFGDDGTAWMGPTGAEIALGLYGRGPVACVLRVKRVARRGMGEPGPLAPRLSVRVNDVEVSPPAPVPPGWSDVSFKIPEGLPRKGANRVTFVVEPVEGEEVAACTLGMVDEEREWWGLRAPSDR
jgi:hypothetical protein